MASTRKANARKPEIVLAALEERMRPLGTESESERIADPMDEMRRSLKRQPATASDKGETEQEA